MKLYNKKAWMYQKYVVEGLDVEQIAELTGASLQTIYSYLDKFGLRR